jgi:hypothetical protein
MIGGAVTEIGGGKAMLDGTVYEVDKGKVLAGGTIYKIEFETKYAISFKHTFARNETDGGDGVEAYGVVVKDSTGVVKVAEWFEIDETDEDGGSASVVVPSLYEWDETIGPSFDFHYESDPGDVLELWFGGLMKESEVTIIFNGVSQGVLALLDVDGDGETNDDVCTMYTLQLKGNVEVKVLEEGQTEKATEVYATIGITMEG